MNLIFILFTGLIIGISGAIIPGPLTLFTVSETLKTNRFAGLKVITGHIILEFFLMLTIFLGFHRLFTNKPFLLSVSIIGGLALITMGVLLFLNSKTMKLSEAKGNSGFEKGLIVGGIIFSASSPGFFIWWATIGISTIIKASLLGIAGIIILLLGHWLADVVWYGFLSYAVDKGKMYLTDETYQNIIRLLSALLIILGLYFLYLRG